MFIGLSFFVVLEIIGFLVLLTIAVDYEIFALPLLVVVLAGVCGFFLNGLNPLWLFNWIADHQFLTVFYIFAYLAIGVAWSFYKWHDKLGEISKIGMRLLSGDETQRYSDEVKMNPNKIDYYFKSLTGFNFPVKASTSKNHITTWMAFWPVSIVVTVCRDWLVRLWDKIYSMFSTVYQKMADDKLSGLYATTTQAQSEYNAKVDAIVNKGSSFKR